MEQGEMWAEAVSQAAVAAEMLAAGYVLYRFFRPFAEKKRGALAAGTAYSVAMLVLYILPKNFSRFSAYGMGILAALAVFSRLDRKRYGQKVFLAAVFFSLRWLTWGAAEILYDKLYRLAEESRFMLDHPDMWLPLYRGDVPLLCGGGDAVHGDGRLVCKPGLCRQIFRHDREGTSCDVIPCFCGSRGLYDPVVLPQFLYPDHRGDAGVL